MTQQQSSGGFVAGAITIMGLGLVWVTVATNFPSQEEWSSVAVPAEARQSVRPLPSLPAPSELDLTIPSSPPLPREAARSRPNDDRLRDSSVDGAGAMRLNPRAAQVAKLRCESEIEQLCPDSSEGSARTHCLDQRAKQLSPPCQGQVRERFVKWKEDRHRMKAACEEDVKRFCQDITPGGGQILQCLQSHAPDVSDRCYETLPKGTLYVQ